MPAAPVRAADGVGGVAPPAAVGAARPRVSGKFLYVGDQKFYVRGVSYGPFRPEPDGCEYHDPATVERDFSAMARLGINSVRTYTVPPAWLLDAAGRHGLKVMVGLPWEQHIAFLENKRVPADIERRAREAVRTCAGHPAVLCFAVGNEIPAHVARWYGPGRIAAFLARLARAVKQEDHGALVTYANYPSTEYLDLQFLDFVSFNVYLETQPKLEAYLAKLQNIAGERPLVMSEVGLDSQRNGEGAQARVLEWQVRTAFAAGCAGAFIFAWTDEWHRGGYDVEDWAFGITTRERTPKLAAEALRAAFAEVPFPPAVAWPKASVVICTYNGSRTIRQAIEGALALDYPDYEVIVVDDGSRDAVPAIVKEYPAVRVIRTENRGLSSARNTGMHAATGEIVVYLDDDAWPDPHWLKYLAATFLRTTHAAVGGPNLAPPGDGMAATAVAHAPGGPNHVLLTDTLAEHIPGCNMAFRKAALEAVGGFDEQFRIAGDDVDVCWRIQDRLWTLGFSPAAMVWHRRRSSVRAYWRQQLNYGRAEAMLERKWPHKYNALGNPTWEGRLYGKGLLLALGWRHARIYHGTWGSALFQSVYHRSPGMLHALPTTPEWYLILAVLSAVLCWSAVWPPLMWVTPFVVIAATVPVIQSVAAAWRAYRGPDDTAGSRGLLRLRLLTAWLHLIQPAARLLGKVRTGLTPWRRRGPGGFAVPTPRSLELWSDNQWRSLDDRLRDLEGALVSHEAVVVRGGDFDDWDLEVRGGLTGSVRARMTIEEHGSGQQMVRLRVWPRFTANAALLALLLIFICDAAAVMAAWNTWATAGLLLVITLGIMLRELGGAMSAILHVTPEWSKQGRRRGQRRGGRSQPQVTAGRGDAAQTAVGSES